MYCIYSINKKYFLAIGIGKDNNGLYPNNVQSVEMLMMNKQGCSRFYGNYRKVQHIICARGRQNKGTICDGDFGSPLVKKVRKFCLQLFHYYYLVTRHLAQIIDPLQLCTLKF